MNVPLLAGTCMYTLMHAKMNMQVCVSVYILIDIWMDICHVCRQPFLHMYACIYSYTNICVRV